MLRHLFFCDHLLGTRLNIKKDMATDKKETKGKEVKAQMKVTTRKFSQAKKGTEIKEKKSKIVVTPSMIAEKNKYEARIVDMIDELEVKIVQIKSDSQHLKDQAREKFGYQIESLTRIKESLKHSLNEIRESSAERWNHFEQTAEQKIAAFDGETKNVVEGIRGGFNYLLSKFRKK